MGKLKSYGYLIEITPFEGLKEVKGLIKEFEKRFDEDLLRQRGKEDGERNIPDPTKTSPSQFEKELLHVTARLSRSIGSIFRSALEQLDGKIKAEENLVKSKRLNELEKIEAQYEAEKYAAEDAFGLEQSHKELVAADNHFQNMQKKYGRAPVMYIPHWLYVCFAILIFVGEIPLNAMVFQIFAESQVMTWVMAFVVGLSVPISAHFIGIKFREHPDGFSFANALKAIGATALIGYALYWLSLIRQTYLGENREMLGLSDALIESSFMFFWLNLAIFAAAIMVAYLSHDSAPGFAEAKKEVFDAKKEVEKRETRRVKRLKSAAEKRAQDKDHAEKEHREQIDRVNLLRGTYDQLLIEGQEYESRCERLLMEKISIYRHENIRHREDKAHPIAFDLDLDFEHELLEMGEKLNNEELHA